MKFFLDAEFIEGSQTRRFLGIPIGKTKPTIDLISIALVSEIGQYYYAIHADFNLYEAWHRYQINAEGKREYWLRENVLFQIWKELSKKVDSDFDHYSPDTWQATTIFCYDSLQILIEEFGKSKKTIAKEILRFVSPQSDYDWEEHMEMLMDMGVDPLPTIEFIGYYSDYDWVVFCWLFGKMIDLPVNFPMYCTDLRQTMQTVANFHGIAIAAIKSYEGYPRQQKEHSALEDALWNRELYFYLKKMFTKASS